MIFALSKFLWAFAAPGNLLALLLAAGAVLAFSPRPAWARRGRALCFLAAVCLASLVVFPVGDWALTPLENRFAFNPPQRVDGIIVLGGDEQSEITQARGVLTAFDSTRRYVTVLDLARRYPDARLVFSGGSPDVRPQAKILPADVARGLMADIGVPTDRMVFEKDSRNTYENAVFSATVVHPEPSQKWLLVTGAWHMPRAIGCFRKAGWNVFAAPSGYFTTGKYTWRSAFDFDGQMHALTLAAHEYIGLAAYWLMGRTSALWPG